MLELSVAYSFLPKTVTAHAAVVMDHFGIGFETGRHVIADRLALPISAGDSVCFTGPSGSGKSSLMRAAAEQLARAASPSAATASHGGVVWCDRLDLGEQLLVDGLGLPAAEALPLLAACGLGEAQLLLRTPAELSDGQRYRFRLAKALACRPRWLVADEFTAALDRTLARVIAHNLRKLTRRMQVGCLLATTHEDVLADLQPDVHVHCRLDGRITVVRADDDGTDGRSTMGRSGSAASTASSIATVASASTASLAPAVCAAATVSSVARADDSGRDPLEPPQPPGRTVVKKKRSASRTSCGCRPAPVPTGRISLGGITAAIN
uniref:ABC transporter domain-containing protein n=1 Tax=Schlesneria paludicola TaxID=360056 RepID=A0A7C4LLM7_9PLAN